MTNEWGHSRKKSHFTLSGYCMIHDKTLQYNLFSRASRFLSRQHLYCTEQNMFRNMGDLGVPQCSSCWHWCQISGHVWHCTHPMKYRLTRPKKDRSGPSASDAVQKFNVRAVLSARVLFFISLLFFVLFVVSVGCLSVWFSFAFCFVLRAMPGVVVHVVARREIHNK